MDRTTSFGLWRYGMDFAEAAGVLIEDLESTNPDDVVRFGLLYQVVFDVLTIATSIVLISLAL